MSRITKRARALINALSDDPDDYPDMSAYRMIKDKETDLLEEIRKIEECEKNAEDKKALDVRRREIIERLWERSDLLHGYDKNKDLEIEADGWAYDGQNHFNRKYWVSVDGAESHQHDFAITFEMDSDIVVYFTNNSD